MDFYSDLKMNDEYLEKKFGNVEIYYKTVCNFEYTFDGTYRNIYCSFYLSINSIYMVNQVEDFAYKIPFKDVIQIELDETLGNKPIRITYGDNNKSFTNYISIGTIKDSKEIINVIERGRDTQNHIHNIIEEVLVDNRPELHPLNDRFEEVEINGKYYGALDGLLLDNPNQYKPNIDELDELNKEKDLLRITISKSKSKYFETAINLMKRFDNFEFEDNKYSIKVTSDMEYLEHRYDIEELFFLIKNWKKKSIYLEGKLYEKYLIEYRDFITRTENRIKRILNYSYGDSFDFVINDDNRAYITYYPLYSQSKLFAFRDSFKEPPFMCSCTKTTIQKLQHTKGESPKAYLHPIIKSYLKKGQSIIESIQFKDNICFRCNKTTPSLVYSSNDSKFRQYHGWYIDQVQIENDLDNDIYGKEAENILREEYGVAKIGEGWISETMMFRIVEDIFEDYECERHCRPNFLEGLEIDIYVPELKLGFEYNGIQHYKPVDHWGGEESLKKQQVRDKRKQQLCDQNDVKLIIIKYDEQLSKDLILSKIPVEYLVEDKS
ncbi:MULTISPECIES: hypothetical protein [Staphylococcus]|uniref:hypothetical protein n=1 Tax=Staphylococcus TaxID=1279 RepID=UPI00069FCCDE|nr:MULTISPECIES: hypothetical protein [Staphylococcus]OHQ28951.1 hypothetical protein HMPREF2548_05285 [Staphylococcus sp. HMSC067G10]